MMILCTYTDTSSRKARRCAINPAFVIQAKPLDWSPDLGRWRGIALDLAFPGGAETHHILATPELFAAFHLGKITDQ